jgi:hypothetical protein
VRRKPERGSRPAGRLPGWASCLRSEHETARSREPAGQAVRRLSGWLGQAHSGKAEIALVVALFLVYEGGRGLVAGSFDVASRHAHDIAQLEQQLNVFWEAGVQRASMAVPGLPNLLGLAYVSLHLGATVLFLFWLYRRHRSLFPLVRTALITATGLGLAIHIAFPTAPPRLAGLGLEDTVTHETHINLSSDLLGSLYNPIAAVPSMHFGYALVVGSLVALLARKPLLRALGVLYAPLILLVIVATGNHFIMDAVAGAAVVFAAWLASHAIVCRPLPAR